MSGSECSHPEPPGAWARTVLVHLMDSRDKAIPTGGACVYGAGRAGGEESEKVVQGAAHLADDFSHLEKGYFR